MYNVSIRAIEECRARDEPGDVRRRQCVQAEDREGHERLALTLLPERECQEQNG
jgi:hypothetical protein